MCYVMIDFQTVSFTGLGAHLEEDHTHCGRTTLSPSEQRLVQQMALTLGNLAASDSVNLEREIQEHGTLMISSTSHPIKQRRAQTRALANAGTRKISRAHFPPFPCVLLVPLDGALSTRQTDTVKYKCLSSCGKGPKQANCGHQNESFIKATQKATAEPSERRKTVGDRGRTLSGKDPSKFRKI